ncbi:MAG TPA: BlaI/MecI/CopY family transcriptional regulator [Candidatus Acidoferrum sp.]|nr:BlaI/MecI/CopY family transcriptional regulator [Candidatus Acidoferrum sp.]
MTFFSSNRNPESRSSLGTLEARVMEVLWLRGESSVRDVFEMIDRPLAYTTIMTTLERLFKKGLLSRCKSGRAFLYSPAIDREQWERRRAGRLVAAFLDGRNGSRELLVSSLLDAIGHHDAALLEQLEKSIRQRRKQLSDRSPS